jgi:hypothetical protein
LEGASNDTGLSLFFLGALERDVFVDLSNYSEIYYSFEMISHENLEDWSPYFELTIEFSQEYIIEKKNIELLRIAYRIFEKLKRKIGNKVRFKLLEKAIEIFKYEILMFQMRIDDTSKEKINQKNGALQGNPTLTTSNDCLHLALLTCYRQLKAFFRSKLPQKR